MDSKTSKSQKLYTSTGSLIKLGDEMGRGGEGSVYALYGRDNEVAKLFHTFDSARSQKISAMLQISQERLLRYTAWPIETLHNQPGGPIVGLVMPKVVGYKEIHKLYSPKTRLAEFPEVGFKFLVHTASNIARAIAVVHETGQIIGDINHSNIMVSQKGTVILIDCDSFQITTVNQRFACQVGVSTHQPPELQGKSLRNVVRNENHDNFGLAVLIFQILFMGRHPFAGRFLGSGDMSTIETAIQQYRFAYGKNAKIRQMEPPPGTLPLESHSPNIAYLFERAFSREGSQEGKRPSAVEWINSLDKLNKELKQCPQNPKHNYHASLSSCPWCEFENKYGFIFFSTTLSIVSDSRSSSFQLEVVWKRILAVKQPVFQTPPQLPWTQLSPTEDAMIYKRERKRAWKKRIFLSVPVLFLAIGLLLTLQNSLYGLGLIVVAALITVGRGSHKNTSTFKEAWNNAKRRLEGLNERWNRETSDEGFRNKFQELRQAYEDYQELPKLKQKKFAELSKHQKKRQLEAYLDQFHIRNSSIKNIGPGRKTTLQSYGIETAKDITKSKILSVPGFGPSLLSNLLDWRKSIEDKFKFDPKRGVPQTDLSNLDKEISILRMQLEKKLLQGEGELQEILHQMDVRRKALSRGFEQCRRALLQAEADLDFLKIKRM